MFWIIGLIIALVFFKLGALTVIVKLLAAALQFILLALIGVGIYYVWKKYRASRLGTTTGEPRNG